MTAPDKQAAIQKMTEQLGYAFDTTLIAPVATLLLVLGLWVLRRSELAVYDRLFAPPSLVPEKGAVEQS